AAHRHPRIRWVTRIVWRPFASTHPLSTQALLGSPPDGRFEPARPADLFRLPVGGNVPVLLPPLSPFPCRSRHKKEGNGHRRCLAAHPSVCEPHSGQRRTAACE